MALQGLDSRTNPFQEGEDDNNMDSMDRVKALEELDGHKIKKYNVWKVHLSEEKEERGHMCIGHLIISRIHKRRQPNKALTSLRVKL